MMIAVMEPKSFAVNHGWKRWRFSVWTSPVRRVSAHVFGKSMKSVQIRVGQPGSTADPAENWHFNVKKLPKTCLFFPRKFFFLMVSFWQVFYIQMAIFQRVRSTGFFICPFSICFSVNLELSFDNLGFYIIYHLLRNETSSSFITVLSIFIFLKII